MFVSTDGHSIDKKVTAFLDAGSLHLSDLDLTCLRTIPGTLQTYNETSRSDLIERTADAWCVIVNKVKLDADFFKQRPNVRLVCIIATGTNNVDLQAAKAGGVSVVNCRDYSTESVVQHCFMLILMLLRSMKPYLVDVADGNWSCSTHFSLLTHPITEVRDLSLGVVGFGDIGQRVAKLGEAFGMQVVISERVGQSARAGRKSFNEVLKTCDIISLHCPLTEHTRNLIGHNELAQMKPNALLINTARGDLIDEQALLAALSNKVIAGAALDVLTTEPPPENSPVLCADLPNLIVTPHIAWASRQARQSALEQTVENILAWLQGEKKRSVV